MGTCLRWGARCPLRLNWREALGRDGQLRVQAGRQLLTAARQAHFCLIRQLLRLAIAGGQAGAQEARRIGACPGGVGHTALHPGKGRHDAAAEEGPVLAGSLLLLLLLHLEHVCEIEEAAQTLGGLAAVCCGKERVEDTCKPHTDIENWQNRQSKLGGLCVCAGIN